MTNLTRRNFFRSLAKISAGVVAGVLLSKVEIDEPEERQRLTATDVIFEFADEGIGKVPANIDVLEWTARIPVAYSDGIQLIQMR
jgi:hypothetical protein